MPQKRDIKTFVVTSPLENEGKTTVAVNLSIALSDNGWKVLLIDADLRKPFTDKMAGFTHVWQDTGIGRVLRGEAACESAIIKLGGIGLSVLLNSEVIPNPSELLSSARMKELIAHVAQQFDFVIIDSPPTSILADSMILASYADAAILTLRQDYASVSLADEVVQSLSESKAELVGCVFNIVGEWEYEHGNHNYRKYWKSGYTYGQGKSK